MVLQAIVYTSGSLKILNQLKLPFTEEYDDIQSVNDAWSAIKEMRTRGAPAIAIVAVLSLAVELETLCREGRCPSVARDTAELIEGQLNYLITSRPTAVNLADAAGKLKQVVFDAAKQPNATGDTVKDHYTRKAEAMLAQDVLDNEAIGRRGAQWLVEQMKNTSDQESSQVLNVLTHCNTGSLATAGYGTALGIIRSLHAAGALQRVYCTETRPYNQGARLTAFEILHDSLPGTLITDSMAAALMHLKKAGDRIHAVIVGADRVAANGDTANKIGTYSLAVVARHHGVKFLVAAPRTTIDLQTMTGATIVVEERPGIEVSFVSGPKFDGVSIDRETHERVCIAAPGVDIWNPAFDVTPAALIDAIVTEVGVVEKGSDGLFDLKALFQD